MLTETIRGEIVDAFTEEFNSMYQEYDVPVGVYRHGERFKTNHPYIMISFLPANIPKFRSVSNLVGTVGSYYRYGFCQVEVLGFHAYVNGHHISALGHNVNGRLLCADIAEKAQQWGFKRIDEILRPYGGAIDVKLNMGDVVDNTYYDTRAQTQVYNYDVDFFIRTSVEWNRAPEYYEGDEIVEEAVLDIEEPTTGTHKTIIIRVN